MRSEGAVGCGEEKRRENKLYKEPIIERILFIFNRNVNGAQTFGIHNLHNLSPQCSGGKQYFKESFEYILLNSKGYPTSENEEKSDLFQAALLSPNIIQDKFVPPEPKIHPWKPRNDRRRDFFPDPLDLNALLQKLERCETRAAAAEAKLEDRPKFKFVQVQKIKPSIARNLALYGKPIIERKLPKMKIKQIPIQRYNPTIERKLPDLEENSRRRKIIPLQLFA